MPPAPQKYSHKCWEAGTVLCRGRQLVFLSMSTPSLFCVLTHLSGPFLCPAGWSAQLMGAEAPSPLPRLHLIQTVASDIGCTVESVTRGTLKTWTLGLPT